MTITRKVSREVVMACSVISLWCQEVLQFAIFVFQASPTAAHSTMKIDFQTIFFIAITARVFMTQHMTLSAVVAVQILVTVIIADP